MAVTFDPLRYDKGPGDLYEPPDEPEDDAWEVEPGISPHALRYFARGMLQVAEELVELTARSRAVFQYTASQGRQRARSRRIDDKARDLLRRCEELDDFLREFIQDGPRYEATAAGLEHVSTIIPRALGTLATDDAAA